MNAFLDIAPGVHVIYAGAHYVITHILSLDSVLAKNQETGKSEGLCITSLRPYEQISAEVKEEVRDFSSIPEDEWNAGEKWYDIIKPLLSVARRTRKMVEDVAKKAGVHASTIYRKINDYFLTGRVSSLTPSKSDGGRGKSRLSEEKEAILQFVIKAEYLDKPKHQRNIDHTYTVLKAAFQSAGLKLTHKNTLRNRIKSLLEEGGEQGANEKNQAYPGHFPGGNFPLAVVQIDHTKFDVILVDDKNRRSIGRPWVTVMIDVFSRMVVGYHISLDPPCAMSVGLCTANAILTKDRILSKFGIGVLWPCWGVMAKIHADNAKEFRGKMLKRACKEYGIDLEWRPVRKARYGAHIERLLGTVLKKVHSIPGTTFSNITERGEYDSDGNAIMTQSEFEHWFLLYIVGVYHQAVHSALKRSPSKQYELGILGNDEILGRGLPRRITNEDRLLLDLMDYEERTVQTYGFVIDYVYYFSDILRRYVNAHDPNNPRKKLKFIVKQHPKDISVSYFYDPEIKDYFSIPYRDTSHPPMSKWEFRKVLKELESRGVEEVNETVIFETYAEMMSLQEKSERDTKRARREEQRRRNDRQHPKPKAGGDSLNISESAVAPSYQYSDITPFEEMEELNS